MLLRSSLLLLARPVPPGKKKLREKTVRVSEMDRISVSVRACISDWTVSGLIGRRWLAVWLSIRSPPHPPPEELAHFAFGETKGAMGIIMCVSCSDGPESWKNCGQIE